MTHAQVAVAFIVRVVDPETACGASVAVYVFPLSGGRLAFQASALIAGPGLIVVALGYVVGEHDQIHAESMRLDGFAARALRTAAAVNVQPDAGGW